MNLSNTITRIKLKLGLLNIATPIENLDDTIKMILEEITVPTFSVYSPVIDTMNIETNYLELVEDLDAKKTYILPEFKTRKLLYVLDVNYDTSILGGFGYYASSMPVMGGSLINQAMLSNAGASLSNTIIPKITFDFIKPNKIALYNCYCSSKLVFKLGFEHDKSLVSIPETAREAFLKLAMLDVKENLYPTMKQYNEINTVHGTINLKIDDWASAESDRTELLNQWDDAYHMDTFNAWYLG